MATTRVMRYQYIEILVPTGSTSIQFNFPDQPQLRNARVVGIELYTSLTLTFSPISGLVPVANADIQKFALSLLVGNLQQVDRMPLPALNRFQDSATPSPFVRDMQLFNDLVVSWTKSFVSALTAPGTTNRVFAFGVYFWLPDGDSQNNR